MQFMSRAKNVEVLMGTKYLSRSSTHGGFCSVAVFSSQTNGSPCTRFRKIGKSDRIA
jgi:hypothetical protein